MAPGIDVAEHRADALPHERVRGRYERESGHDDLVHETEGAAGDLEGDGAVGHGDAVSRPRHVSDALLELPHTGPVVREPARIEDGLHSRQKTVGIANVRAADVKWLVELRDSTEDRQLCSAHAPPAVTL